MQRICQIKTRSGGAVCAGCRASGPVPVKEAADTQKLGGAGVGAGDRKLLPIAVGHDKLDGVTDPYLIKSSGLFKNTDCYHILQFTVTYSFAEKCRTCHNDKE